jgi:glycosyltransferase involved in cell wall biosynthesis
VFTNGAGMGNKTLVFLLTEDWFFASHFLKRALAAKAAGWRVILVARSGEATPPIRAAGIEVIPVNFNRRRTNPIPEILFTLELARLFRRVKPDLVHHIALKPILIGGFAARIAGVPAIVNAPVGLGFVFSSEKLLAKILRPVVGLLLRLTLSPRNARVIFENPDDLEELAWRGMIRRDAAIIIRGAGVNINEFAPAPEPLQPVRVILIARMIREKGIGDFVEAARILRDRKVSAQFLLAGAPDPGNPDTVNEAELRGWEAEGLVYWLGPRKDVAALLRGAHIACQPSTYREGLPKSALEAMAAGKPLVATDIPGCREAVVHEETGFLVPPREPIALADALQKLIESPELRIRMGTAGRRRAERYFADEIICRETLLVYETLVNGSAS